MSREGRKFDLSFFVVLAFLLASIHGLVLVPFWPWRGLDLQNLYAFHSECARWPIPYDVSGSVCGDALGRSMVYPPLMYWAMAWLRFFDFYRAELLWSL